MRDVVFISHANPEDNVFARWLYAQLSKEGYLAWCDLPMLIGGEDWWRDIEDVIRNRTAKFVYVLSKGSNHKDGCLRELRLALTVTRSENLHDFIIPLHIDDLPYAETNIELQPYIQVPFEKNWAAGLNQLLTKLEKENVPKSSSVTPTAVNSWWRSQFGADRGVKSEPEEYLSNVFPIVELPESIYFHRLSQLGGKTLPEVSFAYVQKKDYLVTFASKEQTADLATMIEGSFEFETRAFCNDDGGNRKIPIWEARRLVVQILNSSWLKLIQMKKLPTYQFADNVYCFFFPKSLLQDDKIHFDGITKHTYRKVCGTLGERFWHFGLRAKAILYPQPSYVVKPHVLFSDDGETIWESKDRLHRARRKACKNWWNEEWRDRILATMSWLSNDAKRIAVPFGENASFQVLSWPTAFVSDVSYLDPPKLRDASTNHNLETVVDSTDNEYDDDDDEE